MTLARRSPVALTVFLKGRGGGVTHSSRHDRALPRAGTRLPIELVIVSLEQVSLVQDKADLAQQVKGRWRGGIG